MSDNPSAKVVQIEEFAGFTKKLGITNSSRLLQDCGNTVLERSSHSVSRALDNVDDALFALADKASNNALQSHYFDAMREIRIKRQDIESSFKQHFRDSIERLIEKKHPATPQNKTPNIAEIGLSLVEDDDLEESLAITTLVDKLEAISHGELYALDKRIGLLLGRKELETGDNPIGPKALCTSFKMACANIESGVDIKIIVFKLFDRYICETIQGLYHNINNHLAMSGILPRIPTQIGNGRNNLIDGSIITSSGTGQNFSGGEPDVLMAFSQLMPARNTQSIGTSFTGYPVHAAPIQGAPGILHDLTLLQKGQWEALGTAIPSIDTAALANGTANVLWGIKESRIPNGADTGDQMVIEIVALLFDYIFENQKVPDRAKALIGRLQIPILKVAMLDNSFFSKRNHPARRLLNTLAQSAIGLLNEGERESALYKEIDACIQNILDNFDEDIGVFEAALENLEGHLEKYLARLDENIEETKKLIQGRERLMIAESMSIDEIERRLDGKPFPQFIRSFAMESWKNLLIVTYMKDGHESDAWRSRLEMLDLLIWSTLPKSTLKDKKKLVDMLPTLLTGIEEGMKLMSMDMSEQDEFLGKLASCHARAVNSEAQLLDKEHQSGMGRTDKMPGELSQIDEASTSKTAKTIHNLGSIVVEEIRLLGQEAESNLDSDRHSPSEQLEVKLNLFNTDTAPPLGNAADNHEEQTVIEDECTEIVRNMVPGIWFEFHQDGVKKSMERLAWISSVLGTYLFTNHDGLKTREMTTKELEENLRSGCAILADDLSFLVDRSFNSLLTDMQKKAAG